MCDLCKNMKNDTRFSNGERHPEISNCTLYRVTSGNLTQIKLCFIHQIELYLIGERRFLQNHLGFAKTLAERKTSFF